MIFKKKWSDFVHRQLHTQPTPAPAVNVLHNFPSYCKDLIQYWIKCYSHSPTTRSVIALHYLWFNSNIKVNKTVVFYKEFSENQLNFVTDIFDFYGKLKSCSDLVKEYYLN